MGAPRPKVRNGAKQVRAFNAFPFTVENTALGNWMYVPVLRTGFRFYYVKSNIPMNSYANLAWRLQPYNTGRRRHGSLQHVSITGGVALRAVAAAIWQGRT